MAYDPPERRSVLTDPGIILLGVLLALAVMVFGWWPTETQWNGVALVAWLMLASVPVIVLITLVYVVWMERLERIADKDGDRRDGGSS